jgi:hypothetical protein
MRKRAGQRAAHATGAAPTPPHSRAPPRPRSRTRPPPALQAPSRCPGRIPRPRSIAQPLPPAPPSRPPALQGTGAQPGTKAQGCGLLTGQGAAAPRARWLCSRQQRPAGGARRGGAANRRLERAAWCCGRPQPCATRARRPTPHHAAPRRARAPPSWGPHTLGGAPGALAPGPSAQRPPPAAPRPTALAARRRGWALHAVVGTQEARPDAGWGRRRPQAGGHTLGAQRARQQQCPQAGVGASGARERPGGTTTAAEPSTLGPFMSSPLVPTTEKPGGRLNPAPVGQRCYP